MQERHPGLAVHACDSYAGLAALIEQTKAEIVYSVRFDGTPCFPRSALLESPTVKWVSVGGAGDGSSRSLGSREGHGDERAWRRRRHDGRIRAGRDAVVLAGPGLASPATSARSAMGSPDRSSRSRAKRCCCLALAGPGKPWPVRAKAMGMINTRRACAAEAHRPCRPSSRHGRIGRTLGPRRFHRLLRAAARMRRAGWSAPRPLLR